MTHSLCPNHKNWHARTDEWLSQCGFISFISSWRLKKVFSERCIECHWTSHFRKELFRSNCVPGHLPPDSATLLSLTHSLFLFAVPNLVSPLSFKFSERRGKEQHWKSGAVKLSCVWHEEENPVAPKNHGFRREILPLFCEEDLRETKNRNHTCSYTVRAGFQGVLSPEM